MSRRHLLTLLALSGIWGGAFALIEIGLRDLEPASLIGGRIGSAALALVAVAILSRRHGTVSRLRPLAGPLAIAALFNTAIPFFLIAWGQQFIDSGVAAILNASAPLFTALIALGVVRAERVTGLRLVGFVLGFVGVVSLVGAQPSVGGNALLGSLAVVGAAACYAVGALYTARRLGGLAPLEVALGTMLWASLFTVPVGLVQLQGESVGWEAAAAVAALGVAATALAYILYFTLIAGAGASRAILVTYLVPALALVYGVTLLGEPLTASGLGGLALILGGVALGTGAVGVRGRIGARLAGR